MRVLAVCGEGGLDNLEILERPTPVPGPGEILIRITAASLNHRDLSMIRRAGPGPETPFVPLSG